MAKRNICIIILCYLSICICSSCKRICINDNKVEPILTDTIVYNDIDSADTIVETPIDIDTLIIERSIREELIDIFQSQVGVKEVTDNSSPEIDMYLAAVGLDPGYPWCGALLGWGFKELNLTIPNGAAWSPSWFPNSRVIDNEDVQMGDVGGLYFSSLKRIAHVFVFTEGWNNSKNLMPTIEGNTNDTGSRVGNAVHNKYRSKNQINKSSNWIDI